MKQLLKISAAICSFIFLSANAKPNNFMEQVTIKSQRQTIDIKTNIVAYVGDVVVTQGTMQINADKLQIQNATQNNQQIITATGSPVKFKQTLEDGKIIAAEAQQASYNMNTKNLTLTKNAKITQGENQITSEQVHYNLINKTIEASGNQNTSRVTSIFTPEPSN